LCSFQYVDAAVTDVAIAALSGMTLGDLLLVATNRIGKRWVEVLKGLAVSECFLVFVCAYCETQDVNPGEVTKYYT
jgi:hypothetical protein